MPLNGLRPRSREQALSLWSFVGTVLVTVSVWAGVGYATAGDHADAGPNHRVIETLLPGGVRTDGVILLVLAALMAYTVVTPFTRSSKWILRVFAGHAFLVGLSFVGSWIITHEVVWGDPVLWLGLGALAEGMVMLPPSAIAPPEEEADRAPRSRRVPTGGGVGRK